jgi:hypothetical protein
MNVTLQCARELPTVAVYMSSSARRSRWRPVGLDRNASDVKIEGATEIWV